MSARPPHVAVLAGGKGTRFWPVGRASRPKQLLALDGDDPRPLLVAAWERAEPLCDRDGPWVVVSKALLPATRRLLPARARARLLAEPAGRNTAAAVALAAVAVRDAAPGAALAIVPSDHHVAPDRAWRAAVRAMLARAASARRILTLGLRPAFPATGYGYLEVGERRAAVRGGAVHAVRRFVEKPVLARARRFVAGGRHLWNLGTFAFLPEVFLRAFLASFPAGAEAFRPLLERGLSPARVAAAYRAVPSLSVDYAVMEKQADLEVVAASFSWDDLGSWDAVGRHARADAAGNVLPAGGVALEAERCFVRAEDGTTVALLGVSDLVVVRTRDALLVARRGRGEDVRRVYEELDRRGRKDLLS
ncbi:MAG: mannose-1-phosphate guanylyltransferase [Planctomycetes bacterium]|nr:mannose-1-phosphate guanylyltransferase [Planctomycetota bacterium]